MKSLRIMTVCGFGLGTSLILRMTVDEVLSKHQVKAETFCVDADTAAGQNFDIVITSQDMARLFKESNKPVVVIDNFLSIEEVEEKALPVIQKAIEEQG